MNNILCTFNTKEKIWIFALRLVYTDFDVFFKVKQHHKSRNLNAIAQWVCNERLVGEDGKAFAGNIIQSFDAEDTNELANKEVLWLSRLSVERYELFELLIYQGELQVLE